MLLLLRRSGAEAMLSVLGWPLARRVCSSSWSQRPELTTAAPTTVTPRAKLTRTWTQERQPLQMQTRTQTRKAVRL